MLKFQPIVYNDSDLRAFKYVGTSSCLEGQFVKATSGTSQHIMTATLYNGTKGSIATVPLAVGSGTVAIFKDQIFPIFRENPDPETVAATIAKNDYVVGFRMTPGNEFQVHKSVTESGYASTFTAVGGNVCLGSTGKLTYTGAKNSTGYVVGICLGTFNAAWVRVRVI